MRRPGAETRRLLKTTLIFLGLLAALNGAYQVERRYAGHIIDLPYTHTVAWAAGHLAGWVLPFPVEHQGEITLCAENASVVLRGGCNGLEAIFIMAAAVIAFPAPWDVRLRGLLVYLPALFLLNLVRVVMLLYVVARHPDYVDIFHLQVGQGILVVFIFGFWMHYVRWAHR